MFKDATEPGKYYIGQTYGRYQFPPPNVKKGLDVTYQFDLGEYTFFSINVDSEGKLILNQGRIPPDFEASKDGNHSILIQMIDSDDFVVASEYFEFEILKPTFAGIDDSGD